MSAHAVLAFEPSKPFLVVWLIALLAVALVVVPLVILCLFRLIVAGVRLHRHTGVAMDAAIPVRRNTDPVPQLAESLQLIRDILEVSRVVERHGAELERVLKRAVPPQLVK